MQWGLSSTFDSLEIESIFVTKTAGELLFDGYEDPLLAIAEWMGQSTGGGGDGGGKFGWFYGRNGTTWADGLFQMRTGAKDATQLGKVVSWNGRNRTNYGGRCGEMRGSACGFNPPGSTADADNLELFSHDACRTLAFNAKGAINADGVAANVFKLDETTFANATVNADNACFENNLPTGVQNATECKVNAPAFLSMPHFYLADAFYADQFAPGSILPEGSKHESRMIVEPVRECSFNQVL